ncbi:MAG: PilX N-terminal domain-containing pilus assembly protein [Pseudomonadota bacterium]
MSARREHGAVLLVALCVMLILLMLGVSAARTALNAEKSARAERDRQIALHAAEAALDDAERDIDSANDVQRASLFARGSGAGFVDGCGSGAANLGLCLRSVPPAWQRIALDGVARTVEYGRFTGAMLPVGHGTLPARLPRYVIELMPYARAGADASARIGNFYRITAIGFGASDTSRVVLQSYYLKAVAQ